MAPIGLSHFEENERIFKTNYLAATDFLTWFVDYFKKQKRGHLIAISSIGHGRGIPDVSAYFSSKSALTVFMESLRNELAPPLSSINVSSIHPGFIQTKMATGEKLKHNFTSSTQKAAKKIINAIANKKSDYRFPLAMRILTSINRALPQSLYDWTLKFTSK
jgi:short-subunit dehydrogenase